MLTPTLALGAAVLAVNIAALGLLLRAAQEHRWGWRWLVPPILLAPAIAGQLATLLHPGLLGPGQALASAGALLLSSALLVLAILTGKAGSPTDRPTGGASVADQLAASERQYRFLVERIPEAFVVIVEGKLAFTNRAFKRIFGVTTDQVIGKPLSTFIRLSQRPSGTRDSDSSATWSSQWAELEICHSSGTPRWVEVRLQLAEWEGKPAQIGLIADITARRRAEDAVRREERLFAQGPVVLIRRTADAEATITFVSANVRHLGFDPEQLVAAGTPFLREIVVPDDAARVHAEAQANLAAGKETWEQEYRIALPDGDVRWILDSTVVGHDRSGEVLHFDSYLLDITARKQAEEAQRDSEERFHSFFDNASIGFYRTTPEGRVLLANPAILKMLHYRSFEELTRRNLEEQGYRGPVTRRTFLERIERDGEVRGFEAVWPTIEGSPLVVVENAKAIRDASGRTLYYDGSVEDITERKKLEERLHQLERVEAIGQLAGGIAHDFNNMLLAIRGSAEILLRRLRPGDVAEAELATIRRASMRAAELTRHLLAYARRQVLEPLDLDLNAAIQDMLPVLRRVIPENVEILLWPAEGLATVNADRGQIEQVLMNLCINARDAMPAGGSIALQTSNVEVGRDYVENHPWAHAGRFALLTVTDTGMGMDSSTLAHVFEPFFTTKAPGRGTGLGLATVYGIIKQHGGMVDVTSQPGAGTTFHLFLPSVDRPPQFLVAREGRETRGGNEMILVVDDEPEVRRTLREVLGGLGYRVLEAGDGAAALAHLDTPGQEVDLVVTDVVMPQMGGVELFEAARRGHPHLRFLFSTGYSEAVIDEGLLGSPGTVFLAKPYGIDDLALKIREALDSPALPDEHRE